MPGRKWRAIPTEDHVRVASIILSDASEVLLPMLPAAIAKLGAGCVTLYDITVDFTDQFEASKRS